MKGKGGVGRRKIGKHKKKGTHKQAEREEFQRRHIDQVANNSNTIALRVHASVCWQPEDTGSLLPWPLMEPGIARCAQSV